MEQKRRNVIPYCGAIQIDYHPETLEYRAAPAHDDDRYPRRATWTVEGYVDDETGMVVA